MTVPEKCYQPMTAGLEAAPVAAARPQIPWVPIVGAAAVIGVGVCAVSGCFDDDDHDHRPPNEKPEPRWQNVMTMVTTTIDNISSS